MKTVGFEDWNIDIVKSNSVAEVADRLANLDRLEQIKKAAAPQWATLKNTQDNAMKQFAAAVRAHSEGLAAPAPKPINA